MIFTKNYGLNDDLVVVSPDHGGVTRARLLAREFAHASVAIIDKHRDENHAIDSYAPDWRSQKKKMSSLLMTSLILAPR